MGAPKPKPDRYYAIRNVRAGDIVGHTARSKYVRPIRYSRLARLLLKLRLRRPLVPVGIALTDGDPGDVVRVSRYGTTYARVVRPTRGPGARPTPPEPERPLTRSECRQRQRRLPRAQRKTGTGRIGYLGREGSVARLDGTTFGPGIEQPIVLEDDARLED